jgi:hypothetical protein
VSSVLQSRCAEMEGGAETMERGQAVAAAALADLEAQVLALYVCLICMPYMYAALADLEAQVLALYVGLMCMPYMLA